MTYEGGSRIRKPLKLNGLGAVAVTLRLKRSGGATPTVTLRLKRSGRGSQPSTRFRWQIRSPHRCRNRHSPATPSRSRRGRRNGRGRRTNPQEDSKR